MVPIAMCAVLLDTEGALNDPIALRAGPLSIYPSDVLLVLVLGVIALQLAWGRARTNRWSAAWVGLLGLSCVSLVRGVLAVGVESAAASNRAILLTSCLGLFASMQSIPRDVIVRWITWSWVAAATAFGAEALRFLAEAGLGSFASESTRALNAPAALVVAQAGLLLYWYLRGRGGLRYVAVAPAALLVLVSQQRTVQLAGLVGLLAVIVLERPGQRIMRIAAVSLAGIALVVALINLNDGFAQSLDQAVSEPSRSDSTFAWRVSGWKFLAEEQVEGATVDLLFGDPAGADTERRARFSVGVRTTTASAHSQWFESLVEVGLVGLALTAIAMIGPLVVAARRRPIGIEPLTTAGAAALVFTLTYQVPASQAMLLGSLAALIGSRTPQGRPLTEPGSAPLATVIGQ
jgi:O-antigen ligase